MTAAEDADRRALLTPREVAAMFGVSVRTVTRWMNQEKLRAAKTPGGRNLFRVSDIDAFLQRVAAPRQSSVTRQITERLRSEQSRLAQARGLRTRRE